MKIAAVIVAAGRGERAGGGRPKQFRPLGGKSVLARVLERFNAHPRLTRLVVVANADDGEEIARLREETGLEIETAAGGATRTASVRAGLAALDGDAVDAVLIHDAARPFTSADLIDRLCDALADHAAIIPGLPVADALMRAEAGEMGDAVDRTALFTAQTPQAFHLKMLREAYESIENVSLPDDAAVVRAAGQPVRIITGEADNFKLTTPEDFMRAERLLAAQSVTVTGQGYDVHRLEPADHMMLCGVRIEAGLGLVGHSDADAGLHALTDAILGAAGRGDIGEHFPPSDPQWKGAGSDRFVEHAIHLLNEAGGRLVHCDITLICERPKIGPYRDAMRERVAMLTGLPASRVNIKATTTEKLGFTGRGEGLAAQAVATARLAEG